MVDISDGIQFRRDGVDPSQWPVLSCSQANQLALGISDLRLDANREIFLQGNGQLRSSGDMLFLTGGSSPEKLRILADGNIGIGTTTPSTKLDVNGTVKAISFQGDGSTLEGLVRKTGDTMTGPLTIQNALTVSGNVGIGTTTPSTKLDVNGTVKAISFQGDGSTLEGLVRKTGDTMTGSLTIQNTLTVSGNVGIGTTTAPSAKLEVNGTVKATSFQGDGSGLTNLPGRTQWSNTGSNSISYSGSASIGNNLSVTGSLSFGSQVRQMINLWGEQYGIGVQSSTQYFRSDSDFAWFKGGTHNDATQNPGGGARLMALNSAGDLILSARTNPTNDPAKPMCRALVDLDKKLAINFANDYADGVEVGSSTKINGNLDVTGNITGRVAGIGIAVSVLQHGQSAPIPAGFTKQECVFITAPMLVTFAPGEAVNFKCFVDNNTGKMVVSPDASQQKVLVQTIALAKKGGW